MERAIQAMQQAIELAPDNEQFREHIQLYRSGKALRIERPTRPK